MTKHSLYARHSGANETDRLSIPLIKRCIREALRYEDVDMPCEVSILITSDRAIREINREFRGIDEPTDVISFPMIEFSPPGWAAPGRNEIDPDTNLLPLGEIVLSGERVHRQALEYGHDLGRETAYLIVHSVLHLLGYDHIDEMDGKKLMRKREDEILKAMEL